MQIRNFFNKGNDSLKKKQIILFGTMAAVVIGGVSVVYAADTNISSHGEILFDNKTTDTSDDVFFNAADLEMLNKEIDEINSNLGGLTFCQDKEGNWGFKPSGADSVVPFKSQKDIDAAYNDGVIAGKTASTVKTVTGSCNLSLSYTDDNGIATVSVSAPSGYTKFVGCYLTNTSIKAEVKEDKNTGGTASITSSSATSCTVEFTNTAHGNAGVRCSASVIFIYLV